MQHKCIDLENEIRGLLKVFGVKLPMRLSRGAFDVAVRHSIESDPAGADAEDEVCEALCVTPFVPKPQTSGAKAAGRFGKQDFVYQPDQDVYRCPAGSQLPRHMTASRRA